MAFDIALKDNGVGTFDINLENLLETEKSVVFLGLMASFTSSTTETFCVFEE